MDYEKKYYSMLKLSTKSLNEKNEIINKQKNENEHLKEECKIYKEELENNQEEIESLKNELKNSKAKDKPNLTLFIIKIIIIMFSLYGFFAITIKIIDYSKNIVTDVSTKEHIKNLYKDEKK